MVSYAAPVSNSVREKIFMKTLKIGVIGLGFMGRRYCAILNELPQSELVAVADVRKERGQEVAASLGTEFLADGLELAARPDIEAVAICTPEHAHFEYAMEAIHHGKHVLVEKPIAHTIEAAEQMTAAARKAGLILMVGHTLRFDTCWVLAKERIDAGEIGEVKTIRTQRVGTILDHKGWLEGRVSLPLFYGVHDLDVQRWFAGSEPVSIYAQANSGILSQWGYEIEDTYWAIIRFQNGILGVAELGWHYQAGHVFGGTGSVEVIGTKGSLAIQEGSGQLLHISESCTRALDTRYGPQVYGRTRGIWRDQVEHFVHCVLSGEEPRMTGEDATEALRLSLAMERSAKEGRVIELAR